MNTHVPLISSGVAGPLGVLHLPRLWMKVSLEQRGALCPGYPGIGKGYDAMVLDALGLKADAVTSFIKTQKPTYPQFEAWVKKQPGVKLDFRHFPDGYVATANDVENELKRIGHALSPLEIVVVNTSAGAAFGQPRHTGARPP